MLQIYTTRPGDVELKQLLRMYRSALSDRTARR